MTSLTFPFTEEKIRALGVSDEVLISGVVFTGRELAARFMQKLQSKLSEIRGA